MLSGLYCLNLLRGRRVLDVFANGGRQAASETQIEETIEAGLVRRFEDPNDGRRRLFLLSLSVLEKLQSIDELERNITLALAELAEYVTNYAARTEFVLEDICFNIFNPDSAA